MSNKVKGLSKGEMPFSSVLKAKVNFVGKVALSLRLMERKRME